MGTSDNITYFLLFLHFRATLSAHSPMKHFWHAAMMIHGFTALPAALVVLIYSFGAMILLGQWMFFLWCVLAFAVAVFLFVFFAIASE